MKSLANLCEHERQFFNAVSYRDYCLVADVVTSWGVHDTAGRGRIFSLLLMSYHAGKLDGITSARRSEEKWRKR